MIRITKKKSENPRSCRYLSNLSLRHFAIHQLTSLQPSYATISIFFTHTPERSAVLKFSLIQKISFCFQESWHLLSAQWLRHLFPSAYKKLRFHWDNNFIEITSFHIYEIDSSQKDNFYSSAHSWSYSVLLCIMIK